MSKAEKMDLSEWPDGLTRVDLVSAARGSRRIVTRLSIDDIEDLILGAGVGGADD